MSNTPTQKKELPPEAFIVLSAVKAAGRKAFFETNEFISKRLVSGQYHLYSQLACVTTADVRLAIDVPMKASIVSKKLQQLTNSGLINKKSQGNLNLYWVTDPGYLTAS